MLAVNYTNLRDNMKTYMDKVTDDYETMIVTRKDNKNESIGKPEPLTGNLAGFWNRRMNDKDRIIYKIDHENVYILACRYHYSDT